MRIISKFHDYYDIVRRYGVDPKLVYLREMRTIEADPVVKQMSALLGKIPDCFAGGAGSASYKGIVCFCGRAYPFVVCRDTYCYTIDDFVDAWKRGFADSETHNASERTDIIKMILNPNTAMETLRSRKKWRHYAAPYRSVNTESWKALLESGLSAPDDTHRRLGSPVFVIFNGLGLGGKYGTVVNPRLKDYWFFRQVGVIETYQKLAMYVGNNLVVQKDPEAGLTDVKRRDAAGFDGWSFKKHRDDPKREKKVG